MNAVPSRGLLTNLAISALFLGTITLPAVGALCGVQERLLNEKRKLAEFPVVHLQRAVLGQFPKLFEAYVNDQFPFRDRLIRWNNLAKLRLLGISPHVNVTLGKNDWLFLTYETVSNNPHKCRPFSPAELERARLSIEGCAANAAHFGAKFIFLMPPDKQTIYPELYTRKRAIRLDQLMPYMHAHSNVPCLDLRQPLWKAKAERQLYYRTDSHWNDYGAHATYLSVGELLRSWYPQMRLDPLSEFDIVDVPTPPYAMPYYGDLPWLLGFADVYREPYWFLSLRHPRRAHKTDEVVPMDEVNHLCGWNAYATEQEDTTLPKAVIFYDSFGVRLNPLLSENFRRAVFIPSSSYDPNVIERERPDVVILEMVERKLEYFVAPDPDPAD